MKVDFDALAVAGGSLTNIGGWIDEANTMVAGPTSAIIPAAADEVSAALAELFSSHGQLWQALAAQAATFHQQFVGTLQAAQNVYQSAESANAQAVAPGIGENIFYANLSGPSGPNAPGIGENIAYVDFAPPQVPFAPGLGENIFHVGW